jgi:hypothetical protein|nr:MAG TPA_asm: hypothetical protein [Caudoviricetes sp.]
MYELRIGAYKGYDPTTDFISSKYIPRTGELIKKYRIYDGDDGKRYYWTLEVQKVHYELFEDESCMPVVYANVIKDELIEEDCNE